MPGALGPVIYQATVGGVQYNNNPPIVDANLQMAYGQHDMLFLRIEQNRGQMSGNATSPWTDGTPISLVYGRAPNNLAPWYGYINHSENTNNSDSGTNTVQTTYVATGTSANMNQVRSYNWQGVSPTYVAQQMAQTYGMRAVVTPIGVVFDSEMQNQSDFQFLNYLANKYGLNFRASNGTLYMTSPIVAVNGASGATPIFQSNKTSGFQDTLRDFDLIAGQNQGQGNVVANQTVFGIDSDTGLLYSATASAGTGTSRSNVLHSVSPTSYQDAQAQATGAAALNQFWVNGTGLVYGYPSLYPGKTVNFQGGALPGGYSGNWMVTKATHNLMSSGMSQYFDRYSVSLEVARNSSNGLSLASTMLLTPETTDCNLANGIWTTQNPAPIVQVMT